ncbi:MAG: ArsR/SmtB family transcription factor [Verrucomicrobiota bacterium]|jgi:ArsR family transcriptional regulator
MMNALGTQIKREFEQNNVVCSKVIDLFQLISNKSRFRILCILSQDEFCVNDIAEILGETKLSNISQQLRILSLAGVIAKRKENKFVFYRLADERFGQMLQFLRKSYLKPEGTEL